MSAAPGSIVFFYPCLQVSQMTRRCATAGQLADRWTGTSLDMCLQVPVVQNSSPIPLGLGQFWFGRSTIILQNMRNVTMSLSNSSVFSVNIIFFSYLMTRFVEVGKRETPPHGIDVAAVVWVDLLQSELLLPA